MSDIIEKIGSYTIKHIVPHYIPFGQMDRYLAKKEEQKNDLHEQNLNVQDS